jgi:hypothetical protein
MADTAGRSAVGNAQIRSGQLERYCLITACALVRMLCDICDPCRRMIDYTIRLKVRYAHLRSVFGRYRGNSTAITSLRG